MDRFSLNTKNDDIRGQEIRLAALDMAVRAAGPMGRMDGPLGVAREFENYIRDGGAPAKPAPKVETPPPTPAQPGSEAGDKIEVIEPGASGPTTPPSLKQAAGQ